MHEFRLLVPLGVPFFYLGVILGFFRHLEFGVGFEEIMHQMLAVFADSLNLNKKGAAYHSFTTHTVEGFMPSPAYTHTHTQTVRITKKTHLPTSHACARDADFRVCHSLCVRGDAVLLQEVKQGLVLRQRCLVRGEREAEGQFVHCLPCRPRVLGRRVPGLESRVASFALRVLQADGMVQHGRRRMQRAEFRALEVNFVLRSGFIEFAQ